MPCPQCEKRFRGDNGLNWHLEHLHGLNGVDMSLGSHQVKAGLDLDKAEVENTASDPADQTQWAEDIEATLEEIQRQVDSLKGREEIPEPIMAILDELIRRVDALEAQVAYLPQVRQLVEGLVEERGSMRRYDADKEIRLRVVYRILRKLENPERTDFATLAHDGACECTLEEARKIVERSPLRPKPRQFARPSVE